MNSKRQRPPTGQSRVLDETRARRSSALGASGQAAGRGMAIDAKGRYESVLPRGFYWSTDGVPTMRLGGLLTLIAQSPERYDVDTSSESMRTLLKALAPTTDDVRDAGTGLTTAALLQVLRDLITGLQSADTGFDGRITALEAAGSALVLSGVITMTGDKAVTVPCAIVHSDPTKCAITLTRQSEGAEPASLRVPSANIADDVSFDVISTSGLDDGTVLWRVDRRP